MNRADVVRQAATPESGGPSPSPWDRLPRPPGSRARRGQRSPASPPAVGLASVGDSPFDLSPQAGSP